MAVRRMNSVCPYDCPDACGLIAIANDNRIVQVIGNPDHAFTRGTLCPKMVHYEDTVHSPDRLTTPLKRVGKKGEGKFEPITWDEAISTIAKKFKETAAQYGGESIMPYSYAGTMGFIQKSAGDPLFARIGATRQDRGICSPAKSYGWAALMGGSAGTKPQEAQYSDFIILWSLNAVATDIHIWQDVYRARDNGAKVWVIDTHRTATYLSADETVTVKPGSDGALALGLIHIMERDGLTDKEFIAEHVSGYDKLKATLGDYTPEKVAEITGVSVERLTELAHAYAKARAPFIRLGSGLSRYGNGAMTVRCVACLPAVVGAYKEKGGGFLGSTGNISFISNKIMSWASHGKTDTRLVAMIKLGEALTNEADDKIRCLYVYSSNPAITSPNQNLVRKGLAREDLFLVVHERFMTDTAKYADIVLPATTSLEHSDIYSSYGHYSLGIGYKVIDPIGESKSNWDTIRLLAKAMGYDDPFFDRTEEDLIDEIVATAPRLTDEERKRLLATEPVEMELPEDYKLQYDTPSGKIEMYNPKESEPLPRYFPPYGDDAELWLINSPDVRILDSSFNERNFDDDTPKMAAWLNPKEAAAKNLKEGQTIELSNVRGKVRLPLYIDEGVAPGTVVSYGVWWQKYSSDANVSINALTASRPTDCAWGSTFYDVKVNIRPVGDAE